MTVRTMSAQQQRRFIKHMEAQGCEVVKKKSGFVIRTPDGGSESVHISYGDRMGLQADISRFRKRGLHHPDDPREPPMPTSDADYPKYITSPITSVTRRKILSDLEAKGWPLEIKSTEINLDTATANRALFAVGYRWHPKSSVAKKVWVAPDEIREMHEKVKAEMKQREEEARAARRAAHAVIVEPGAIVITNPPNPADVAAQVRAVARANMPDKVQMPTPPPVTEEKPYVNPGKTIEETADPEWLAENTEPDLRGDLAEKVVTAEIVPDEPPTREPELVKDVSPTGTTEVIAKPIPEREFIDTVDSWVVDEHWYLPREVQAYLESLRGAGLDVEIRVWRTPRAK